MLTSLDEKIELVAARPEARSPVACCGLLGEVLR
jgi:hypothetical protein